MEDGGASTSFQWLTSTLDTLIESPEADITSIPVVRPESFPAGNNRDIPVSLQELVYGSKAEGVGTSAKSLDRHNALLSSIEEVHGPRRNRRTSEGLDTHVLQGTSPTDKSLIEKPRNVVRGPEEEVGPRKRQQPSGISLSLHKQKSSSRNAKQGQPNPKEQSEGQAKGKGKGKIQVEQALPTELQNSQEREDSYGQCVKYGMNSYGTQKQGGGKIEPIISKEVDLVSPVTHVDTCNKEISAKINNFEYIQQKLGREILILRKFCGDLEHAIRSRCIEPFSTEDYINAMEGIKTRIKIGSNWYKPPMDNKTIGKPIPKPNNPHDKALLKCHKCVSTSHLENTCPKNTRINEIEIDKIEDTKETNNVSLHDSESEPSKEEEVPDESSIENINVSFEVMEVHTHLPQYSDEFMDLIHVQDAQMQRTKPARGKGYTSGASYFTNIVINNREAKLHLYSGAFGTCVGKDYLDKIYTNWKESLMPIEGINFSSASQDMHPLGIFEAAMIFHHPAGSIRL
ncbi:hypothetical protein O181_047251 [Austropuccinia psidii MF-1]|uniref:Uncharacterized protein n=1 Tax=Austropuccinia psidii MF-1 TaxID=1389203 RepID=A0A9Q3HJC4_9BASI|nr:hypothetical protein [Austropuccinia psidii MF-1]